MPHRFVQPACTLVTVALAAAVLGACASKPPPQMIGAVTPLANGEVQSSVMANDKTTALKAFDHDAKIHCTYRGGRKPEKDGRYVVLSQDVKEKSNAIGSTGDARLDVAATLGSRLKGLERRDDVEIVTMFKCEG